jgi:hypothetical protein
LAVISPFSDFSRGENRKTVEAAAKTAALQFHTIESAMFVSRLQHTFI